MESGLTINRYIHLNPVRIKGLGGHEARAEAEQRLGPGAEEVDKELVRARVEVLNSCRWSSYPAYVGKVREPDWLSIESIRQLFGSGPEQSFRSAYRRQLEEMAGLGKWEEGWKESVKASVLHGTEEFVAGMLKELKGDRREQTGMREKERLSLEWSRIVAAIAKVWKAPWRCPAKEAWSSGSGVLPRTAACGNDSAELGKYMGEVEYPAVSVAIARFQNRLKTERSLQRRVKQIDKLLKVEI